jgi:hypothetical protein
MAGGERWGLKLWKDVCWITFHSAITRSFIRMGPVLNIARIRPGIGATDNQTGKADDLCLVQENQIAKARLLSIAQAVPMKDFRLFEGCKNGQIGFCCVAYLNMSSSFRHYPRVRGRLRRVSPRQRLMPSLTAVVPLSVQ